MTRGGGRYLLRGCARHGSEAKSYDLDSPRQRPFTTAAGRPSFMVLFHCSDHPLAV